MIKTNTRRRVVSVLLALVMLASLMPSLVGTCLKILSQYIRHQ